MPLTTPYSSRKSREEAFATPGSDGSTAKLLRLLNHGARKRDQLKAFHRFIGQPMLALEDAASIEGVLSTAVFSAVVLLANPRREFIVKVSRERVLCESGRAGSRWGGVVA